MSDEVVIIKPIKRKITVHTGKTVKVSTPGKQGPRGLSGAAANSYEHNQLTPSDTWVIFHELGFNPNISVFNSAGDPVYGVYVVHDTLNQTTISFSSAFGGKAILS